MPLFELTDYDKEIYEKELKDFLPKKIIDVHAHVWLDSLTEHKEQDEESRCVLWPDLVALDNSIEDLDETYHLMFPNSDCKALFFTNKVTDANNEYCKESSKKIGWPALYYSKPTESPEEVVRKIKEGGFLGIKSYLSLSPSYIPTNEIRIFDFFPKNQLEAINKIGGIVMCHIPRSGRLKDPVNLEQILEIRREFPNIRLIVAHIGRAYTPNDIGNAFTDYLNKEPETMYDFSANCCEYAITELIKNVGVKHVMFGTDMPILRMRTRRIIENNTYINLVPKGIYGDSSLDPHLREVSDEEAKKLTFFAYEELLAFKRACKTLNLSKEDVEDIMYNNAYNLIEGARLSIYGEKNE